jgi:hypothetical protein
MELTNTMVCLARGHAFRKMTHQGSLYRYCVRCGRLVWLHSHVPWERRAVALCAVPEMT